MDKHGLIAALKKLTDELGRTPKRYEYEQQVRNAQRLIMREFGSFSKMLTAAGLVPSPPGHAEKIKAHQEKLIKQYKALCSRREQLQGFFRHVIDLEDLFQRAGNPEVLKLVAQPDTHAKFRDDKAWNCFLKFMQYYNPDIHVIMGDFVDCEGLSHWPDSELLPRRIVPEMKIGREMLQQAIDHTPNCSSRIYLKGNHEAWVEQALVKMPELFDGLAELDIEISLKTLLNLEKFGYQLFPLNELVQIGKAHFTHGVYTGEHHASKHLKEYGCNIYYGHLHDIQETNNTSVEGALEAASLGCLCRLDAKFLKGRKNNWAHAFGVFEFFRDGTYHFTKQRIHNGRLSYNGQVFQG